MIPAVGKLAKGKFKRKILLTMTVRKWVAMAGTDDSSSAANCLLTVPRLTKPISLGGMAIIDKIRFDVDFIHNNPHELLMCWDFVQSHPGFIIELLQNFHFEPIFALNYISVVTQGSL